MIPTLNQLHLERIDFSANRYLELYLSNERTVSVPLSEFEEIQALTSDERRDFEIIDGRYLSFLSIDEVFSLNELLGLSLVEG